MEFLDLNDDCLEHVFRFLDLKSVCHISESCKHLSRIAEGIFKKYSYYKCHIGDEESVKETSKIIRKVGKYITALHLKFNTLDSEVYVESGIGCKFLSLLNRSLGEKFRELKLSGEILSFPVLRLAPILSKLERLSFCDYSDDEDYVTVTIDLPQLCPNLRVLRIDNCALMFAPNPIKSFPNLEALEFLSIGNYYPIDSFVCLIRQNKHLRRLYIDNYVNHDSDEYIDLTVIAKNLKCLEELRIRTVVFDNWVQAVRDFTELHHLTTLVMTDYFDNVEQVNDILNILKTMKQLKKLWIGYCYPDHIPNQQSIVNIAIELKQLESFKFDLNCDLKTISEFVRFGHNLKQFSVQLGKYFVVTSIFIKELAKMRESVADVNHQPLSIYLHKAKLNGDVLKVFKEPSVKRFLKWKYLHTVGGDPFEHNFKYVKSIYHLK